MSSARIAICGKGGVGKTTLAALLGRCLAGRPDTRALLVDADPAGGLSLALGLRPEKTLNDLRVAALEAARGATGDRRELAATLDYLLLEALVERNNLALLSAGRPDERGCYCSLNSLLRQAIGLLAEGFDLTLIDAEAGTEQVNREVISGVSRLLLVIDASAKALAVAEQIALLARRFLDPLEIGLVLNRVRDPEIERIRASTNLPIVGIIPEDELVREFDHAGRSLFELPACPAAAAAQRIVESLDPATPAG